jgi:hypothetical protein
VALDECPPLYPDNTTLDCSNSFLIAEGISAARPGVEQGWFCQAHHNNDDDLGTLDLLRNRDGRLGFWWTSVWPDEGRPMFAQASIFYPDGGDVAIIRYQPTGFVELPFQARAATGTVHLLIRQHMLDVQVPGGDWYEDRNATMLVGGVGGDPWYVWKYRIDGEPRFLDVMVYAPDPESDSHYAVRNQFHEVADHSAFATVSTWGAKFIRMPLDLNPTRHASCAV